VGPVDPWALLTETFGHLPWERLPVGPKVREDYRSNLQHRGLPMCIRRRFRLHESIRGATTWRWTCVLETTYASRPLVLSLSPHHVGWPRISTGDPAFEEHFRLAGAPPDLLQSAFDAELRSQLVTAPFRPWIDGNHGVFGLDVGDIVEDGRGGPRELQVMADVLAAVTQRLCGALDRGYADVAANSGPEAAAQWWSQQAAAVASVELSRSKTKVLILVGAFVFVVSIVLVAIISLVL